MSYETKQLELKAIKAFRNGIGLEAFWQAHADAIRQAEPYDKRRFKRLYDRLLSLVTSGDTAGMMPVGDDPEPWVMDDEANKPSDTATQARCLWTMQPTQST